MNRGKRFVQEWGYRDTAISGLQKTVGNNDQHLAVWPYDFHPKMDRCYWSRRREAANMVTQHAKK